MVHYLFFYDFLNEGILVLNSIPFGSDVGFRRSYEEFRVTLRHREAAKELCSGASQIGV